MMWYKHFFLAFLIITTVIPLHTNASLTTYYSARSQSFNGARRLSGQAEYQLPSKDCRSNGLLSLAIAYMQSFKSHSINKALFGVPCPTIIISGSSIPTRNAQTDWLADYFYLPTDFQSQLTFRPRLDHILLDFNYYTDLTEWCEGLYLFIEAPLEHTRWRLRMDEQILSQGTDTGSYAAGYFTPQSLGTNQLLTSFAEYAAGVAPGSITQAVNIADINAQPPPAVPQMTVALNPLTSALISPTTRVKTRFADVRADLGYVFYVNECAHAGVYLEIAAPAGNRPNGNYFFEAVAGNGHFAELGGGIQGHFDICRCSQSGNAIGFYYDFVATHLFTTHQTRTFDLLGKPFSRYMLAEKMATPTIAITGTTTAATTVFSNAFNPVANLSTIKVNVQTNVQLQATAMFNIAYCDWNFDVGYNFWYRSCDKIKINTTNTPLNGTILWALKGDAQVFGFASVTDPSVPSQFNQFDAIPLSATESQATITSGTNLVPGNLADQNLNVDNAQLASAGASNIPLFTAPVPLSPIINTSIQPVLLSINNLDVNSNRTHGMSSTVFANLSYAWPDWCDCQPFIGVGGQIEVGHDLSSTSSCTSTSLSQWGVWLKAGLAFE
jgi:hypothetical protein